MKTLTLIFIIGLLSFAGFAQSVPSNWTKVSITYNKADVEGLTAKGDVFVKATAGTIFVGAKKVNDKATRKLKIQAAQMGADIVLILSQTNDTGVRGVNRSIKSGIAYTLNPPTK